MRSEFAKKLKKHDWYYAYSDDHRYWTSGRSQRKQLENMHKELDSPFSMSDLSKWAHKMVLEDFEEMEPECWYRKPKRFNSIAPAKRDDLIAREDYDKITSWLALGSTADELSEWVPWV